MTTSTTPWHAHAVAADANGFPLVRAQLAHFAAAYCPPLLPEDAVGLVVFGLSMRLVRFLPPKGAPLLREFRAKCEGAALEIVANAHPELLRLAGSISALEQPMTEGWQSWRAEILLPLATRTGELDERRSKISEIAWSIMSEALSDDLLRNVRIGMYLSRKEHGKPKHDPDDSLLSFAGAFLAMPPSDEKEDHCFVVGEDRKIHISPRYIRDQQERPHRRTMVGKVPPPPPSDHFDERDLGSSGTHIVKERLLSVLESQDEKEALDALASLEEQSVADEAVRDAATAEIGVDLQAVVDEFLAADPTSMDRLLLERASDLINEVTSPTELAREADLPERTVRHAWHRILERMATHPRLRGWGRLA